MDFSYRRRFRWPWQSPEKKIARAEVEKFLPKGDGDRVTVGGLPVRSPADLAEWDAFAAGKPPVEKPELGQALLDLARGGWSFHGTAGQLGLYGAYNAFTDENFEQLGPPVARKDRMEVPLDPERTTRMAGFYNGNSMFARLESEGFEFYSQGERVPAFAAGPQSAIGRQGEVWLESPTSDELKLRYELDRVQKMVSQTDNVEDARKAIAILDGSAPPEVKARQLLELENSGVEDRALDMLEQTYPVAAETARTAIAASRSSDFQQTVLKTAIETPHELGIGQGILREQDEPEVARALLEKQSQQAPQLVKLGQKLIEDGASQVGSSTATLLEEIAQGQRSAPVELARKLLAAGADPQTVVRTLRGTPGWETSVTFFDRACEKLEYDGSAATLAAALLKSGAPASRSELVTRVYEGLPEESADREKIVAMALRQLEQTPETKAAIKLARELELPELALGTQELKSGQDVLTMARASLGYEETSEEALGAILSALCEHKDTRELGKLCQGLTGELSLEGKEQALERLLDGTTDPIAASMELIERFEEEDPVDSARLSQALLKQLARQHPVAEKAYALVGKQEEEDDGSIARIALTAIQAGRGSDLDHFRAECVGQGVDEALERALHGKPAYKLYKSLSCESGTVQQALLEAALRRPQSASQAEQRELIGAALSFIPRYEEDDLTAASREQLALAGRDLMTDAERALADRLNEEVESEDHWAALQPLMLAPVPQGLDELARLGGQALENAPNAALATNLLDLLAAYPETAAGRQFAHEMADDSAADVLPELTRALCQSPSAGTEGELARLGADALDNLTEYPDEGSALGTALLKRFEGSGEYAPGVELARSLTELDAGTAASVVLRHPRCEHGSDLGRLGLALYRRSDNLEPVGAALTLMAEKDDTRDGAPVALEIYEKASYESVALLADTLCNTSHDLNALAVSLKSFADRGETAGEEEAESVLYDDVQLLRDSAMKLEALALTKQKSNSGIEERGAQVVVGGVAVSVRQPGKQTLSS